MAAHENAVKGLLEAPDHSVEVKIAVIGKEGVGKTALVSSLCGTGSPGAKLTETLGLQVTQCVRNNKDAQQHPQLLSFWEAGGRYASLFEYLPATCLADAHVVLFVFSLTDRASFDQLREQLPSVKGTPGILVATKQDLALQSTVLPSELPELAEAEGIPFICRVANPAIPKEPLGGAAHGGGGAPPTQPPEFVEQLLAAIQSLIRKS
eukprot:jgi/Mesvir1/422/Mv26580-RA.1